MEVLDNRATQQALELAQAYNRDLLEQSCSVAGFSVSGAPTPGEDILTALDPTVGGMLATLEIPTIDVILPVYYGTQSATLTAGVGVVEGSSLPVGGTGSHAVLAGHSGLASSRLLSDLDQLTQGDDRGQDVLNDGMKHGRHLPSDADGLVCAVLRPFNRSLNRG